MDGVAADCFDRAMSVNGEAFAAGHYEGAYHALMAALHFARDLGDEDRLQRVARVAGEQGQHIDKQCPSHRLSSQAAGLHGHDSVFRLAVRQAEMSAKLVHANRPDQQGARRSGGLTEKA
jgi:hypothetical protein